LNTQNMTDMQFQWYAMKVRQNCPRGVSHFCDGTPNLSQKGSREKLKPCEHFKKGKCTYIVFECREDGRKRRTDTL